MQTAAANPWEVQSEAPATQAPATAPAPAGSSDQWSVANETPAPPSAPDMQLKGLGGWLQRNFSNPGGPAADQGAWETARGLLGSAAQPIATLLDLAGRRRVDPATAAAYKQSHPEASDQEIEQEIRKQDAQTTAGKWGQHLQDAAKWLRTDIDPSTPWEKVGAIGEQLLEFVGPNELFKLEKAGEGLRAGTEAAELGDKATRAVNTLKNTQSTIATLKNNKIIAGLVGIGLKGVQDAATMGAQSYAHTGDPEEAGKAALLGGGLGAAAGTMSAGGRYLMDRAPVNITRLGETFPVMRQQLNQAGRIEQGNVTNIAPALAEKQQAALPGMMRNAARRATARALEIVNDGRMPVGGPVDDASRLLPAPEGAQDFTFSLETPGPEERPGTWFGEGATKQTGTLISRAEPIPGSARPAPATYGQWAPAEPHGPYVSTSPEPATNPPSFGPFPRGPGYMHPAEPASAIDTRTDMEKLEGAPAPKAAVEGRADVTRAGAVQTKDPHEAVRWMRDLDEQMESPEWNQRSEAERNQIQARRDALSEQLKMYYASPYTRRFGTENIPNILQNVHDFADAKAQLEHVAEPVYQRMDAASNGEFSKYRDQIKQAQNVISNGARNGASIETIDNAIKREAEGNAKILDLIDRHRDQVGLDDYLAAKNTWRQASRLGELHARIESMMNGVTGEETESGMTRHMDRGSTRRLEEYLAKDTNRAQIEELIGKDGIVNLKEITNMFASAPNNRAMQDVGKNVVSYMKDRGLLTKLGGGLAGAALGALFGGPAAVGAGGAALLGVEGTRYFLRYAATNPAVGNMLKMAVDKGISPKVYAPLIARVIAQQNGMMEPQPQQ